MDGVAEKFRAPPAAVGCVVNVPTVCAYAWLPPMTMPALTTLTFAADDGTPLTYHQLGTGRPVVLLHGYMASALPTWGDTGIAERLAADGNCLIMHDMRGHGAGVPPGSRAYPSDALTLDALALIAHLSLTDYELGGYSLGARIVTRALTVGSAPSRAFIGGTGLSPRRATTC